MANVLVTGGAGFIGSFVCRILLSQGDNVVCIDNMTDISKCNYISQMKEDNINELFKLANGNFKFSRSNFLDANCMRDLLIANKIEYVIHLGGRAGVRTSLKEPLAYVKDNVKGTAILLELCAELGIKRFVFGSSASVYGERTDVPFRESMALRPISLYSVTKLACEHLCYSFSKTHALQSTVVRIFSSYGPGQRPDNGPYLIAMALLSNATFTKYGDGTRARDMTYVGDIARGIVLAAKTDVGPFEIINLGNSNPIALNQQIAALEKEFGKPLNIKEAQTPPTEVPITFADIGKARDLLGWQPEVSFEDSTKLFVAWFKEHYQNYYNA